MINADGWLKYSIWEHSAHIKELYGRRCRLEEPEMTCAAQAAELLAPQVADGDTLLDVGCGSGYFFHSIKKRRLPVAYFGIDAAPSLVAIGRRYLPAFGLPPENLQVMRLEDLDGQVDHIICLNVLSNLDNYHRPLERLLLCAAKTVILRESLNEEGSYDYVPDTYLDEGCRLKVYVNAYPLKEVMDFITSYGFAVAAVKDRRTRGRPEMVIGYPHYWKFLVARRTSP
ncbi:MAG: class I SAM-dependent methyltransferase [Desulfobaccales bacterium]|nr:class I SAM-dependent methyltransferase [Desulfobaccales bacterium]